MFRSGRSAILATAIHAGDRMRSSLLSQCALTKEERLREEDPFTDLFIGISDNQVSALRSRFEVDLNRPRHKAVYREPAEAWGLKVWNSPLSEREISQSLREHDTFYRSMEKHVTRMLDHHPCVVVYDVHSYNHQRKGPGIFADPAEDPEINLGTGNLDRDLWGPVVETLIECLRGTGDEDIDVRENVKFRGGYFTQWLHAHFGPRVCPIAIEFKKTFMDEWTGQPFPGAIARMRARLARSVVPVLTAAHSHVHH